MRTLRFASGWIAGAGALALVLGACTERTPLQPNYKPSQTVIPMVVTSALWDFAAIIPGSGDPEDLGTSETISLAGNGSIVATSTLVPNTHITIKGRALPPGDTERGMGLCHPSVGVTCTFPQDGDEVGDGGPGALLLNFNGVLPAGSHLAFIELGSVQAGEGYRYSVSTDGGITFGPATEKFDGDGNANATITFDLPTANLVVKLEKTQPGTGASDNDYTVKNLTTSFTSTPNLQGRMTGGGVKAKSDAGDDVTFGLTLHCDIILSNNLEVNWKGHQWHLDKPIVSSKCSDDPNIAPEPPVAPIDTFEGTAFGKLDGVGNSFIKFKFQDAGEPGSDDTVEITIYEVGSLVNVALHVTAQKLSVGNWQMHYDQPHGQHP